jgi:hypothetical protein
MWAISVNLAPCVMVGGGGGWRTGSPLGWFYFTMWCGFYTTWEDSTVLFYRLSKGTSTVKIFSPLGLYPLKDPALSPGSELSSHLEYGNNFFERFEIRPSFRPTATGLTSSTDITGSTGFRGSHVSISSTWPLDSLILSSWPPPLIHDPSVLKVLLVTLLPLGVRLF